MLGKGFFRAVKECLEMVKEERDVFHLLECVKFLMVIGEVWCNTERLE